jgi:hypothetical protein
MIMGRVIVWRSDKYKIRKGYQKFWVCTGESEYSQEKDLCELPSFDMCLEYIAEKDRSNENES